MKVTIDMGDGFDLIEVGEWLEKHFSGRYTYRVIEIAWVVERTEDDPWFKFEVEFTKESDATMFLLRWS